SVDRTAEVDRLREGSIHRPISVVAVPGGKGLNVARAAHTLGAPARALTLLAGHAGRWIDGELDRLGIPHAGAWAAGETRTCLSVLDRSTNAMTEFYESGTGVSKEAWREFERVVVSELKAAASGSLAVLSGSLPVGIRGDRAAGTVRAAREAGLSALVDTSGPWLAAAIGASPEIVKVNADEAGSLLGRAITSEPDAARAARAIVERGA